MFRCRIRFVKVDCCMHVLCLTLSNQVFMGHVPYLLATNEAVPINLQVDRGRFLIRCRQKGRWSDWWPNNLG